MPRLLDAYVEIERIDNPNLENPEVVAALKSQGLLNVRNGRIQNYSYSGDRVVGGRLMVRRFCSSPIDGVNGHTKVRGPFVVDSAWPETIDMEIDQSGIDEGCADLLYGWVRAILPKVIFETGTHKGRSTHAIVQGILKNGGGHVTTVDMDDYGALPKIFGSTEMQHVTQVIGKSPEVLDCEALAHVQEIDLAFLDGDHTGDTLMKEIEWVDRRRSTSCYVLVDNSLDTGWPEVRQVLNAYHKYPRIPIRTMAGMELIWMHGERPI